MTTFLARLAARQIAPGGGLRPRSVSRFATPEAEVTSDAPVPLVAPLQRPMPAAAQVHAAQVPYAETARVASPAAERVPTPPLQPPRHEARAATPAPPGSPTRARPLANALDNGPHDGPIAPRTESALPPAERPASPVDRAPDHAPLVPREIVRAREPTAPRASVAARVAVAPVPAAVEAADEPVVRITIGRIEVRAAAPAPAREKRPTAGPKTMSLDEYLDRRHGTRR